MRSIINTLRHAHTLALKEIEPGYLQIFKMLAAVIAAILAARRMLVQPGDDLIPSEELIYIAALIIIAPEAIRFILYIFYSIRYSIIPINVRITRLWEPTGSALALFQENKGKSEYPIGGALEVLSPGNITRAIETNGWDPNEIEIEITGRHQVTNQLQGVEKINDGEADRKKYMLSRLQSPFADAVGRLRLQVEETKFSTVSAVSRKIMGMKRGRSSLISCDPSERRVPHSLCLHALCEFDDGQVLMMQRNEKSWYYPGAFSASFEEQLDEHDFRDGGEFAIGHLVSRAVCEEILPLLGDYLDSPRLAWMQANDFISSSRIWSVFLEEEIGNFALFCHIKLSVDVTRYVEDYRGLKKKGGRRDREGKLYALRKEDIRSLLEKQTVFVKEMLVDQVDDKNIYGNRVAVDKLHPTSRYRLLSWAAARGLIE